MTNHPGHSRAQIVGILQETAAAYLAPPRFSPGDLVQMHSILSEPGVTEDDKTPGIVLQVFEDLGAITGEVDEKGVPGLRLARAFSSDPTPEITHAPSWWFELYRGPMPDAH